VSNPRAPQPRRGLVLGAGGVLGAAWTTGALQAVKDVMGIEPGASDIIVGTSSGSIIGALLGAGISPEHMVAHQRGAKEHSGPLAGFSWDHDRSPGGRRPLFPMTPIPGSVRILRSGVPLWMRLPPTAVMSAILPRGGRSMSNVGTLMEELAPEGQWSDHDNVWVVAMDYDRGKRVTFGRLDSPPASLADAVMASCAIPGWFSPVTIDGVRYIDGGACSVTSADILVGRELDEVIVLAPMVSFDMAKSIGVFERADRVWRAAATRRCRREVEKLRASGVRVTVIAPGSEDMAVMGGNSMDTRRRIDVLETSLKTTRRVLESGQDWLVG